MDVLPSLGGEDVYWLQMSAGEYEQLRLYDPNKVVMRFSYGSVTRVCDGKDMSFMSSPYEGFVRYFGEGDRCRK